MPKLINPYGGDEGNPISAGITQLADAMFGDVAKRELIRQKALEARRENEFIPLVADAIQRGDTNNMISYGVRAGMKGPDASAWNLLGVTNRTKDIQDPAISKAYVGAGHSYGGSPMGVAQSEANRRDIAQMTTDRTIASDIFKSENAPTNVMEDGVPKIVSKAEAIRGRMTPYDSAVRTAENTPINIIDPGTQQPKITSRRDAIATGATPVLSESDAKGMTFADFYKTATPAQKAVIHGVAEKSMTPYLYEATGPDGKLYKGTAYSLPDGPIDAQSGTKLPPGAVLKKLEGENAGIVGNPTADNRLVEAITAKNNTIAGIDGIIKGLQAPNAAASLGFVGKAGILYSGLRSQAEATIGAAGGETFGDVFSKPENIQAANAAVNKVLGDRNLKQRMLSAGIDAARLRSQIMDLAYVVAKTQNPSGQIGKADVEHALATIGGGLYDPKLMIPVLQDLKARTIQQHDSRIGAINTVYPKSSVLPSGGAPAAPAAPAMPTIKLDLDGNVIQ